MTEIVEERRGKAFGSCVVVETLVGWQLFTAGVDALLKRLHDVGGADRV
jgi:hypothetical protein